MITKDTTLKEVLEIPGAEKVLSEYKFPCLHCPMAKFEAGMLKLGQVCKIYNIDFDKLVNDLNLLGKNKKS